MRIAGVPLCPNPSRKSCRNRVTRYEHRRTRYDNTMRWTILPLALALGCLPLAAASRKEIAKNTERFTDASELFTEVMGTPDKAIPEDLLEKAHCIVIVPGLKKAAFG